MTDRIRIRRTATVGKVPTTLDLQEGELGLNTIDKKLYSSDGTSVFEIGNTIKSYSSLNTDITSLISGTTSGNLFEGITSGHFVIGIKGDDAQDGFHILDKGNATNSNTDPYLNRLFSVSRSLGVSTTLPVSAPSFSGNGALLTNLNASNISTGTVNVARIPTGTTETTVALGNHNHAYLPLAGGTLTGHLGINNTLPTITLQDTDQNSAFIHVNSNQFYILRGDVNAATWTQVGGVWPLQIDLTNNNATFGGSVSATSFSGSGASLTSLNASNISTGTLSVNTLPTGTTSTTVALGNHTHAYLPLTGGTLTGNLSITGSLIGTGAGVGMYEPSPLGTVAGNTQLLWSKTGLVSNVASERTWIRRRVAGTDWQTALFHNGITVDVSFGTPGVDTRAWWERDVEAGSQSWGSGSTTFFSVGSSTFNIPLTTQSTSTTTGALIVSGGVGVAGSINAGAGITAGTNLTLANQGELRLSELTANGTNYVALRSPANVAANITLTLPATLGANGQVLVADASGNLSWTNNSADNLGNHTATTTLNMANQGINNVSYVWATNNTGGYAYLSTGTAAQSGRLDIYKPNGTTRLGYIGWDPTDLTYVAEGGANHKFLGGGLILEASGYTQLSLNNTLKTTAGLSTRYVFYNMAAGDAGGIGQNCFCIYSYNGSNAKSIPFTILDNDNVGIGTASPAAKLHVSGGALISSLAGTGSRMVVADASGVLSTSALPLSSNLYTADGTLAGNRTVTQGANSLTFSGTGNTILNSGKVGIGNTTPTATLHVGGGNGNLHVPTNGSMLLKGTNGDRSLFEIHSPDGSSRAVLQTLDNQPTYLANLDGKALLLQTSGGNVGIGTTAATAKLTISDTSTENLSANPNWPSGTLKLGDKSAFNSGMGPSITFYKKRDSLGNESVAAGITATGVYTSEKLQFYVGSASSLGEEPKMTIQVNGNVGIGTATPSFKTSIAQDLTMHQSDITAGQLAIHGATTPTKRLLIGYDTNGNGFGFIEAGNQGVVWTNLALQPIGGNVGIGTTSPGAKLTVSGGEGTYNTPNFGQTNLGAINILNTTSNRRNGITFSAAGVSNAQAGIYVHQDNGSGTTMYLATTDNYTIGPQTRLTILNNGNVGIGTGALIMNGSTVIDANGGWHRTYGATGWYNGTYEGGMYMIDTTWVRTYNDKSLYSQGNLGVAGAITVINGISPTNGAIRMTGNLHLNASSENGIYINWDSGGSVATSKMLVVGNGSSGEVMYVRRDGLTASNIFHTNKLEIAGDTLNRFELGKLVIRGHNPTLYFRDYDHASAMIHCNSNILYFLRGGVDTESWSGVYPLTLNLSDGAATFGGAVSIQGTVGIGGTINAPLYRTNGTTNGAVGIASSACVNTNAQMELTVPSYSNNTVHISFHKPGVFASNFGLDADNQFACGGWSSGNGYAGFKAGHITAFGNFVNNGGYVYPGRADASGAYQGNWFLGSHASYGLYTNTGFYASSHIFTAGAIQMINGITPLNGAIRLTPNLHLNAGGTTNAVIINWDSGGSVATDKMLIVGNGADSEIFYVRRDGLTSSNVFASNSSDTVSLPSHTWTGDTNTGMYHPATDQVGFAVGGSAAVLLTTTYQMNYGNLIIRPPDNIAANATTTTRDSSQLFLRGFYWNGTVSATHEWSISNDVTTVTPSSVLRIRAAGVDKMTIDSSGVLTAPALAGSNNRAVYSTPTGALTNATSDGRMKINITPVIYSLDTIKNLNPVTYNWKTDFEWTDPKTGETEVKNLQETLGSQKEIGLIAQEVEKLVPEAVGINSQGTYSLDYPKLVPVLIKGMQEQQEIIERQGGEISDLKTITQNQNDKIEKLEILLTSLLERVVRLES